LPILDPLNLVTKGYVDNRIKPQPATDDIQLMETDPITNVSSDLVISDPPTMEEVQKIVNAHNSLIILLKNSLLLT